MQDREADTSSPVKYAGIGCTSPTHEFRRIDQPMCSLVLPDSRISYVGPNRIAKYDDVFSRRLMRAPLA